VDFYPLTFSILTPIPMHINPTIVFTGATSGIGQLAAIELARRGAHLVLTARDKAKAAATCVRLHAAMPGARVDVHYADFSSLDSVVALASQIATRYERIDVLVNNAGLHAFEQRVTVDGYAEMIAVNYLAPWLLTDILRDTLVRSAPSRIVTVASEASKRSGGLETDRDLFDTAPFTRLGSSRVYGKTKLMNIMFSQELARQLDGTGVAAHCLDPGFNVTGLGRELGFAAQLAKAFNWLRIGDPQRGADIIVRLATDSDLSPPSGGYFSVKDAKALLPAPPADSTAACQELWAATSALLAGRGMAASRIC
jgi:NAD(P)-dependent dehydrogenase (short-subunit alcohol dehydrogenase family)